MMLPLIQEMWLRKQEMERLIEEQRRLAAVQAPIEPSDPKPV